MNDQLFQIALNNTLLHEGGYIHDPDDPGGETKFGISNRIYPDVDIQNLTREQAAAIYRKDYWQSPGFDGIGDVNLACKVFDLGVNMGTHRISILLQEAANLLGAGLKVDGVVGPRTCAWINGFRHADALICAVKVLAGNYYISLKRPKYLAGWLRRLDA